MKGKSIKVFNEAEVNKFFSESNSLITLVKAPAACLFSLPDEFPISCSVNF